MKTLFSALFFAMLVGCASTKNDYIFDGSTFETTRQGVAKVNKYLTPTQRLEFLQALIAIQFADVKSARDMIGDPTMTDEVNYYVIGKKIHGLNYQQVLALGRASPTKVRLSK